MGRQLVRPVRQRHRVSSPVPQKAHRLSGVTTISAGLENGYALTGTGTVWAWEDNGSGELGVGFTADHVNVPVQVTGVTSVVSIFAGDQSAFAVLADGTVWATWGPGRTTVLKR